ncbi:MAG: hypothetical protein HY648_13255 [Acidobacteria bacterium]|nr:hypothetical protein [Acidobacteriota bacterium]
MKTRKKTYFSALLGGGALLTASLLGFAAQQQTLEGTVTDAMCGMSHKMADAKACTLGCAKNGGFALVVGDKVYKLEGKEADVAKFAGGTAVITGDVDGQKVQVASVGAVEESGGGGMHEH